MNEVKQVLLRRFWLNLCTKQEVSARACAHHFLPYNSPGINLVDVRTVQADSCLDSEQNNTLFISVGGHFGPEAQNLDMPVYDFFFTASCI